MGSMTMQSSDFGTDLAIVDSDTGLLDVTFQLAWTLGRSLAMSDNAFSAALMRVRGSIHHQALNTIKKTMDSNSASPSHKPIDQVLKSMSSASYTKLKAYSAHSTSSDIHGRWRKPPTLTKRQRCLQANLTEAAMKLSAAASPNPQKANEAHYDETYPAASTGWATVFTWCLDKWFRSSSIPVEYLIPDPAFVRKESIRTFYVDHTCLRCLVDGAVSVSEHYTDDDDDAQENIKVAFERYLTTNNRGQSYPPQMPRFGMLIRSQLVKMYLNMLISAPMLDNPLGKAEILRTETLDQDLIVVLFDRIPNSKQFDKEISLSPPGHQIHFEFGSGGWNFSGANAEVSQQLRLVAITDNPSRIFTPNSNMVMYSNKLKNGFDSEFNCLIPQRIAAQAQDNLMVPHPSTDNASLLGSQLIASAPQLVISDSDADLQAPQALPSNSLKSSSRAEYTTIPRLPDRIVVKGPPPPESGSSPLPLKAVQSVSDLPVLLANTDVVTSADAKKYIGYVEQQITTKSGPSQYTTPLMKCVVYNLRAICLPDVLPGM
ncbi:MAG: hypothetical protein Q9218_005228 [Villophora microphyllina]